jgi:hypothetical protein
MEPTNQHQARPALSIYTNALIRFLCLDFFSLGISKVLAASNGVIVQTFGFR